MIFTPNAHGLSARVYHFPLQAKWPSVAAKVPLILCTVRNSAAQLSMRSRSCSHTLMTALNKATSRIVASLRESWSPNDSCKVELIGYAKIEEDSSPCASRFRTAHSRLTPTVIYPSESATGTLVSNPRTYTEVPSSSPTRIASRDDIHIESITGIPVTDLRPLELKAAQALARFERTIAGRNENDMAVDERRLDKCLEAMRVGGTQERESVMSSIEKRVFPAKFGVPDARCANALLKRERERLPELDEISARRVTGALGL